MQPPISPGAQFTVRIDKPDPYPEIYDTCSLADLPEHVQTIATMLDCLTVDSAPLMMEVRRVK